MQSSRWTSISRKIAKVLFAGCLVTALGAQVSQKQILYGSPDDWTHHRIRFNTAALRQHPEIAAREPRAALQLYRETMRALRPNLAPIQTAALAPSAPHADWSVAFGTGVKVAPDMFPAKWNSDPRVAPDCNKDYVLYGLNTAGTTGGQANLVAFYNLYSGSIGTPLCGGGQPKILFSYNVTTDPTNAGKILTSPVLSLDGTKVAFLETVNSGGATARTTIFHVLNIPTTPTGQNPPLNTGAQAPPAGAMSSLTVTNQTDTRSSPWVDYPSDTAYFATDNGRLWAVTPVFGPGTPGVVPGFPVVVHQGAGSTMTGPTLDVTGILYIGAANGVLYSVNLNTTPPTLGSSLLVGGGTTNGGILDAPLLDSVGGSVFAVSSNNGAGAVVVQASTSLAVKSTVNIGQGSTGGTAVNIYDGDFDNNFTTPISGHLLVCGTGPANTQPFRYLLPFDSGGNLAADPNPVAVSTSTAARCGPVTDFFNSTLGTDFLFWSVSQNCSPGANGCVMSLVNGVPGPNSLRQNGGASGIIVDNNSSAGQASSIYFSTEGAPLQAVKLTQQNLN